jgi:hypothetical protein
MLLYGKVSITDKGEEPFECETKGSVFPSPDVKPAWLIEITDIDRDAILSGSRTLKLNMIVDYYCHGGEKYWTSSNRTYDPSRNDWLDEEGDWS